MVVYTHFTFNNIMTWITNRLVVVPLDMSEFSMKALEAAREMVETTSNIRILHVLPSLDGPEIIDREQQTRAAMSAFLQEHGYEKLDITVKVGDPVKQITEFAENIDAGLIVIPSHGRGVLTEMLLGSTTYSVVRRAKCPVLVLKEKRRGS
ncbi:universal stress protein [Planctomycetales bacterium]|nr:universal stress protein [Planctomycetales bacterium]